jgi:arylsulfatase A-like enzyme
MQTQKAPSGKNEGIFFYLLLLTGFFILLEISYFIQCNRAYLSVFTWVSNNIHIPAAILPGIFYFLLAQLTVHFCYCVLVFVVTSLISNLFHLLPNTKIRLAISIWTLGILTALVANQYYFPNSKFTELTSLVLIHSFLTKIGLIILLPACFICLLLALLGLASMIKHIIKASIKASIKAPWLLLIGFVLAAGFFYIKSKSSITHDAATAARPNIIIVGIDSLRPDFLGYFGHENSTPFFDSFLNQASVFSDAVTPLARTFPSWTSILSGSYPNQTGIRTNLDQQNKKNFTGTLPAILQRHGYETIYATDETRFSNIDKNYGFDRIITPPMGLNDFLIGTLNDFPLSNPLINTTIGKWLFPYSYANRPVFFTYEPASFLNLVHPALKKPRTKPLFLAIHFCLTHYPYLWASLSRNDVSILARYEASIRRADEQVRDFFALLKEYHVLDHAIVVLLSDHGEALELPGDRITEKELFLPAKNKKTIIPPFYPPSLDKEEINQSAGHGTDVLGLPQYHTLLAFKLYGTKRQKSGVIPGVVSLVDIKPTLFELMDLKNVNVKEVNNTQTRFSGQSLAAIIKGEQVALSSHAPIFLESDFTPEAIRTVYPEEREVLLEGIDIFQIDPITTRLTVKDAMGKMIINSKQYADIDGEWMLALYPQNNHFRMPILINLVSGQWTNDLQSTFAQHSPASHMLQALKTFYGNELR